MAYKVKLDVFEGPFDLLVYLIETAEMSIYDIQVAEITTQYMEYIQQMQKQDVTLAGEFMVLAATLIELKSRMQPEDIAGIVDAIEELGYLEHVIFISFSWDNLVDLRKIRPEQKAQFLISACEEGLAEKLIAAHMDLDIYHLALSPELIDSLHKNGLEVNCWTVDDPELAEKYVEWGVDYITSNILE